MTVKVKEPEAAKAQLYVCAFRYVGCYWVGAWEKVAP